jgi:hypothetical protein
MVGETYHDQGWSIISLSEIEPEMIRLWSDVLGRVSQLEWVRAGDPLMNPNLA